MTITDTSIISPVLRYEDGPAAIDWLARAFGFDVRSDYRTPDGQVAHADLRFGASAIGISSKSVSPADSPWATVRQRLYVRVADPDALHDRARNAGAEIVVPLRDLDYGSREFSLRDPEGYLWSFGTYDMGASGGQPMVWPELRCRDASAAVAWLEKAIGFVRALEVPDAKGALMHAELRLGGSVLMLGPASADDREWSDVRQLVHLRVDDPDKHFAAARAAGAAMVREPQTASYGARFYAVRDPEQFLWWVSNYEPK